MTNMQADIAEFVGMPTGRIGYGTMRLTGPGVIGPPANSADARRVLKRAVELGVRVFDTAWYYGPGVANRLLAGAIRHDREHRFVVATKLGWEWDSRGRLVAAHSPEQLRAGMEHDLELLGTDAISIVHLRWSDDRSVSASFRAAVTAMVGLRDEHCFPALGLSNVGLAQLEHALGETAIASVSNSFSVVDQADDEIVDFTADRGIAYLPWLPLRRGSPSQMHALNTWASELQATPSQVALAWLLERAPNIIPIPGTSSVGHLEENLAAQELVLPSAAVLELSRADTKTRRDRRVSQRALERDSAPRR